MCADAMDGATDVGPPGLWSATGQPNDKFHNFVHTLDKAYARACLRSNRNVLLRNRLQDLEINVHGAVAATHPIEASLRGKIWAMQQLQEQGNGRIIRWAWIATGHATYEQMAAWNNLTVAELQMQMRKTRGLFSDCLNLASIPELAPAPFEWIPRPLVGESCRMWVVGVEEDGVLAWKGLPQRMNLGIERVLTLRTNQGVAWEEARAKRPSGTFSPKQQLRYDAWLARNVEVWVFNILAEMEVANLKKCTKGICQGEHLCRPSTHAKGF